MYSGNIAAMVTDIPKAGGKMLHTYRYDQLNRIKEVNNFTAYNPATNTWAATEANKERLTFDANGNIKTALLNGDISQPAYENFTYTYDAVKKNRLLSISNSVNNATYNYQYDEIGNATKDELEGNQQIGWTVYGKIKNIVKTDGTQIDYTYDAAGNRISKKVVSSGITKWTYYVRDAAGNTMATYIKEPQVNGNKLTQEACNMYSSNMAGRWKLMRDVETIPPPNNGQQLQRGWQEFYFGNHLGNNLVVLSDKKLQHSSNGQVVDWYDADVISATDYSAYGENLKGREFSGSLIKYGFNGKENDADAGYQDYGMRVYSVKARRFPSVDPLTKKYPELTPYQFASNRTVDGVDFDGLEFLQYNSKNKYSKSLYRLNAYLDVPANYELKKHIWVTDQKIHKIIMDHPDNKSNLPESDDDGVPEVKTFEAAPKNTAMHKKYNDTQKKYADRSTRGDIASGVADFIIYVKKTTHELTNLKEFAYGNASLQSLDQADKLMRAASKDASFPDELRSGAIQTAIVNYMTDGYIDGSNPLSYNAVIRTWGNLLMNNETKILSGSYSFSETKPIITTRTIGNGDLKNTIKVEEVVGNPDKDLQEARKLLEKPIEKPKETVSSSN